MVQDEESESGAIYTPASPEKLQPGLSHQVGRAAGEGGRRVERGREKKNKNNKVEETELRSRRGSPSGDFLGIALDSGSVYSAGLVKTIYRCEDLKQSANAKARKRGGGVRGAWGCPAGRRATQLNDIYPHKQKSGPGLCVAQELRTAQGRTSRCFLLSHSPGVTLPVTRLPVSHSTPIQQGGVKAG